MKSILLVLALVGFTCATRGQQKKTAVAAAVEQLRRAMVDADSVMLDKLTAAKLSYGHSSSHVDDKTLFISKIVSGKSDFVTLEFADQTISVDRDVAIVRHKLNATTNDSGKAGEVHLAVLLVWQKQQGAWKLLARQAVKNQ